MRRTTNTATRPRGLFAAACFSVGSPAEPGCQATLAPGRGVGAVGWLRSMAHHASADDQRTFDATHGSMRAGWYGTFELLATFG